MKKYKLSLAIITLNEENNIRRCIESASWADEIVVLDSGSTDATREVAASLGAKVFNEPWRGFTGQKNRLSELCSGDWILNLDADEALGEGLREEIESFLENVDSKKVQGLEFPRRSFHLGKWINHGGWYPDRQLRLYHRESAKWEGGALHERVQVENFERAKHCVRHWVFKDLADQVAANNRYSSLGAEVLVEKGKGFSLFLMLTKPLSKFLETYLFKRGFLDGMAGFVISVGAAYSMFLKYAKLYYMEKQKDS